ncbi:MAG: rod shape-determining protein [bacterium]|nr:rod shape-determining protein [bacterium]
MKLGNIIDKLFGLVSYDIGIDLGTANTLVLVLGKGIVIREPSVVSIQKKSKAIIAYGTDAKRMVGRTPANIIAVSPLSDGVIADFDAAAAMLKYYIQKVHKSPGYSPRIPKPRVVIGIPAGVTEVERRAVQEAALAAGARRAYLIEEPMAAAIGAGINISDTRGSMIVDIGGGTTEMAVIALGGIVVNKSIRIAGKEMDEAIVNYLRLKYGVLIGERTAEELKINIGAQDKKSEEEKHAVVRGRDLETGLPKSLKISSSEVREAMAPVLNQIIDAIKDLIEETPPELVADILEKGLIMAGGGSLLYGVDKQIAAATKMPVWVCDEPMGAVVRGCARVLEDNKLLEKVRVTGGLR